MKSKSENLFQIFFCSHQSLKKKCLYRMQPHSPAHIKIKEKRMKGKKRIKKIHEIYIKQYHFIFQDIFLKKFFFFIFSVSFLHESILNFKLWKLLYKKYTYNFFISVLVSFSSFLFYGCFSLTRKNYYFFEINSKMWGWEFCGFLFIVFFLFWIF